MILRVKVPRKLKPLLQRKRYKGAYGGRGGAKSHFFAEQLLVRCYTETTRAVCIREIQNSIKDSVKQLLTDKIQALGLGLEFDVLETEIRGHNGSLIVFKGMQSYNAENIKSLEAYDIAWVEEAQTLSQHSLNMLRPTLRKEGSELWFSWNPRYKTDPVDAFFRKSPPEDAISVCVNWRDNPWFPAVLKKDLDHDFATDPDNAEHIWNGAYGGGLGSILARWVNAAERQGRIHDAVVFDPTGAPLEISSDIGFRDTASWWFWQRKLGGFALLNYVGESGLDADDWCDELILEMEGLGITSTQLGKIWLPQDAKAKTWQSKYTGVERVISRFGSSKVAIVPPSKKADQISAARKVIARCEFHKTRCEAGLDGLSAWEFEWNEENNVFSRDPVHNWASHPSDAYAYGCQVMVEALPEPKPEDPPRIINVGENTATLNDLWRTAPQPGNRI